MVRTVEALRMQETAQYQVFVPSVPFHVKSLFSFFLSNTPIRII